jgi:hypothetical protein
MHALDTSAHLFPALDCLAGSDLLYALAGSIHGVRLQINGEITAGPASSKYLRSAVAIGLGCRPANQSSPASSVGSHDEAHIVGCLGSASKSWLVAGRYAASIQVCNVTQHPAGISSEHVGITGQRVAGALGSIVLIPLQSREVHPPAHRGHQPLEGNQMGKVGFDRSGGRNHLRYSSSSFCYDLTRLAGHSVDYKVGIFKKAIADFA